MSSETNFLGPLMFSYLNQDSSKTYGFNRAYTLQQHKPHWHTWGWLDCHDILASAVVRLMFVSYRIDGFFPHRNKVIRQMKRRKEDGHSFAFLCDNINDLEHSAQSNLPMVSVVMPLKGFGEHNLRNWRSQVSVISNWYNFLSFMQCVDKPSIQK